MPPIWRGEIDGLRPERLPAGEGEQLPGQAAPRSAAWRMPSMKRLARVGIRLAVEHVEPAGDDHQQIVEVVRHAAGQLADGLDLLRLAQRFLDPRALGHLRPKPLFAASSSRVRATTRASSSWAACSRARADARGPRIAAGGRAAPLERRWSGSSAGPAARAARRCAERCDKAAAPGDRRPAARDGWSARRRAGRTRAAAARPTATSRRSDRCRTALPRRRRRQPAPGCHLRDAVPADRRRLRARGPPSRSSSAEAGPSRPIGAKTRTCARSVSFDCSFDRPCSGICVPRCNAACRRRCR